jgi:hypothetical protein
MVNGIKIITKYLFVGLILIMSGSCLNAVTMVAPQIVIDGSGNATSVWLAVGDSSTEVQSAYKPALGSWGSPVTISDPDNAPFFSNLQVQIDALGDVVVGWLGVDSVNEVFSVYSNTWDASGTPAWVGAEQASTVGLNVEGGFTIGISGGDAQTVWSSYSAGDLLLFSNSSVGGTWGSPVTMP